LREGWVCLVSGLGDGFVYIFDFMHFKVNKVRAVACAAVKSTKAIVFISATMVIAVMN
jgi:hypothetical protein